MVLLVNQHTVPIFTDIANAFATSGKKTILFSGYIEQGGKPLSAEVKRVNTFRYNRKNSFLRIITWLAFSFHYFWYLLFCKKPSVILVVTNPPFAPIITSLVASWRKIPYFILIYDLYPEALNQAGLIARNNILFRQWQKINPWIFEKAIKVFTLSDSMKQATSFYMPDKEKIKVIHNWADASYIRPLPKITNPFVEQYQLWNKTVVLYAGNMGLTHDLESLVTAADLLKDNKELFFLLIGDGGKKSILKDIASARGLENILFLPYQDAQNFPLAMAAADIGVVTLGIGAEGISVPSKTYINMAAGLCLLAIAPSSSELSRLVSEHEVGVVCEPGNEKRVAEALRSLITQPEQLARYKKKALSASARFTSDNAALYVEEILNN